jgi:NADP-dependent 3-hydroxy acid dehydrogenase YdfG
MIEPASLAGTRLQDKVILVTGSTTGIGEGMARLIAREGARVMIHGRETDAAQKVAADVEGDAALVIGTLEIQERLRRSFE